MKFSTTIIGRVGRDAELREVGNGKKVCSFSVATNPYKDKTVWVKVTTWDRRAEIDGQYVKKGMLVYCSGSLQADDEGRPRTYVDGSGVTKASNFELTAYEVKYLTKTTPEDNNQQASIASTGAQIPF